MMMKMSWMVRLLIVVSLIALPSLPSANADVAIPKVIGSNRVLQQETPVPIWGTADTGEAVN
jgi:sialate O-acetylesterase